MNYSIDAFKKDDWFEIEVREEYKEELERIKKEIVFFEKVYTGGMPWFTLRVDGKVIVIYGFMYSGNGTYHPGIIPSIHMRKYTKLMIKLFYEYFATYVPRECRRMETYCDIMDKEACRLVEHFGFDPIGIRHNASARGNDQVIYERLTWVDHRKIQR